MAQYSQQDHRTLIDWFPKLEEDSMFRITSDCTPAYNCIGWALGMNDVWVGLDHPSDYAWNWWPDEVNADERPETLVALFEYFGFELCADAEEERDYDKVVLYANNEGWTHAARVVSAVELHSKIGTAWDIHHGSGCVYEETDYGHIFAYMKRPICNRYLTDMRRPIIGKVIVAE